MVRAEIGLEADVFAVIMVARLDYLKDHATAIRTIEEVAGQCPRARLILVGEGPERGAIECLVRQRNLGGLVRLLGQRGDVPWLMAASDIVLLTSISEGIPLTLIEAMASGLPVVSTGVGGVAEVVADGQTGLLARQGDAAALTEHICRLADDPGCRERMGRAGLQRAEELFSEARMHDAYTQIYEELAGRSCRPRRDTSAFSLGRNEGCL